jgi:hypothetical protein
VLAHCPTSGVKVYVPLLALSTIDGDHKPVIELLEEVGSEGTIPPEQMLRVVPKLKVGATTGLISIVKLIGADKQPVIKSLTIKIILLKNNDHLTNKLCRWLIYEM